MQMRAMLMHLRGSSDMLDMHDLLTGAKSGRPFHKQASPGRERAQRAASGGPRAPPISFRDPPFRYVVISVFSLGL